MANARYLGEIGIDGSSRNKGSIAEQKEFFNGVIHTAAVCGGKVLSIHSRGAVKDVLQILEKNKGDYIPILHWFTGSVAEAEKALELGCWFSINPNMCFSINGQNIIRCLPFDRLLPETDTPFVQNKNEPYMPWDNTVASYLAELNKTELIRINELFLSNLNHIDAFACKHI